MIFDWHRDGKKIIRGNKFADLELTDSFLSVRALFCVIVPSIENVEKTYIRVCLSFFFTKNQVPRLIIGLDWKIY